ncbi:MAG TPA: TadE family protein [Actinomycetales bacterium]|nr:TadE family protein [Actinomycetales bacterium]
MRGGRRRWSDGGAAVVDFVLVGALLTLVFLGVVQLGVVLHVRNTLVDCASEGARYGAFADRTPADGARRTAELIAASLSPAYAGEITARHADVDGLRTVEVTVSAPLPVIGLFGPGRGLTVRGHGAEESP